MENITFKISNECIGCKACVNVAQDNWGMSGSKAFVKKQPENEEEIKLCKQAMKVCPVNAISSEQGDSNITPVLSKSNIKATLDKHPQLKQILFDLSPKFRKLQNPAMYNTLARFATFEDAARLSGMSICEILHTLNKAIGTDKKLAASMPECISKNQTEDILTGEEITWEESSERYIYNNDTAPELIQKISHILPEQNIVIISVDKPDLVLKTAEGLNFKYSIEQNKEYRVSIFNPQKEQKLDWKDRKEEFDVLDVRSMMTDPFDIIIKKAYEIEDDSGFVLVQQFEPFPLINMLNEMGFESITEKKTPNEVRVYFHKKQIQKNKSSEDKDKPSVVIQSATPVAYPVIMRLLQSEKIRSSITIKELKVWEETEKHLGWIVNGKADISFSALITSVKLKDVDVKLPAMFVWDNFYILTRDHNAKNLKDLSGKKIYTPLFEEAPPAKITNYIIRAKGLNPDDFKLVFGEPFGRPEIIYRDFITGKAETVILREPEASYAIKAMEKAGIPISIISYNKIWNEINEDYGSFPNAGIVIKGEFTRNYPELTKVLLEELKNAINWVNNNKKEAAKLSFDLMRQPVENIELFLNRVKFEYVEGDELVRKVSDYFDIMHKNNVVPQEIDKEFIGKFKL